MLQLRNTPDSNCHLSPAQILFGRPLRDAFAFANCLEKFSDQNILPLWRDAWQAKEAALRQHYHRTTESLQEHSRPMPPLFVGDRCYVQNQNGAHPKRWDRFGTVMDTLGHDSYLIKVDGSGRLTQRNRRFLRKFLPPSMTIQQPIHIPRMYEFSVPVSGDQPQHAITNDPPQTDNNSPPPPQTQLQTPSESLPNNTVPNVVDETLRITPVDSTFIEPPSVAISRHRRTARKPATYEPETGKWVV